MTAPEQPTIDDLTFTSAAGDGYEISFVSPSPESFRSLLRWLPENWALSFYDRFYPSPSDPGAYVSIQRRDNGYLYVMGNHGWSSEWRRQSVELLAAWMHLNLELNGPYAEPFRSVTVAKAIRSAWTGELTP